MTATVLDPALVTPGALLGEPSAAARLRAWLGDVAVLTKRNLIHVAREPAQLSDATFQPILFTLLFVYIFQGAMQIPGGGGYKAFAIGGLITMNLTTSSMGTAVGLSSDLSSGVINRFRTLPMSRSAVLAGRTLSDVFASVMCGSFVILTGLAIGWRPASGALSVFGALGVALVFVYALSWFTACIGLWMTDPESAQAMGMIILFPLAFVSSCFAPTQGMPGWMQVIANWNPVSAVAGSCRHLMGDPNPAALTHNFPAQHPVLVALLWSAAIIAVFAPLATRQLRKRTVD